MKWEYEVVRVPFHDDNDTATRLNRYGAEGWEVVTIIEGANFDSVWYKVVMKRQRLIFFDAFCFFFFPSGLCILCGVANMRFSAASRRSTVSTAL